jgi:hypothetical protein
MVTYDFIDGARIRTAHSVKNIDSVFRSLATALARIPDLRYIKIFPERIAASNVLSEDEREGRPDSDPRRASSRLPIRGVTDAQTKNIY